VAESLEVTADWRGGYAALVSARGHEVAVDEPAYAGGEDTGMMPTEVFCAAIASCFCLAVGYAANQRSIDLPDLRVTVRAERAGEELRYGRFVVETEAAAAEDELGRLVERARRLCWVSNTLAAGVQLEYRYSMVESRPPE
jgi:putative redox protein